jgi:LysM repeat protein
MPETDPNAGDVIDSYRRRRNRLIPLIVGGMAVVLLVVGLFLVVLWLTGENPPAVPAFLASRTPTPTVTPTPPPPTETPTITNTPEPSLTPTASGPTEYTVEVNDTLFSIAEKFGVTMDLLISFNGLTDPNNIGVGSKLLIPPADSELPTETAVPTGLPRGSRIEYVVKTGDTLVSIAAKYNSTAEAIALENKVKVTDVLFVGTKLVVPVNIATPTPTVPGPVGSPTATRVP